MTINKGDSFRCAVCGGTFTTTWNDNEAVAELKQNSPDHSPENCIVVCNDCYRALAAIERQEPEQ